MTRPAKARHRRRKRDDDLDQARLDLRPHTGKDGWRKDEDGREIPIPPTFDLIPPSSARDLDREVQEHVEQTRREPLPGQAGLPWDMKCQNAKLRGS